MKGKVVSTSGVLLFLLATVLLVNSSFQPHQPKIISPNEKYQQDLSVFQGTLARLIEKANSFQSNPQALPELQEALLRSRETYKQVEYLMSHMDHQYVEDYINGAPLKKLERNAPQLSVVEPEGLQVLDEMVFQEHAFENAPEIKELTIRLQSRYQQLMDYHHFLQITDRDVFEASRMELIRVFTMGLSGFDTPGSSNAIPESRMVMQSMAQAIQYYLPLLERKQMHQLANRLDELFTSAIQYLEANSDFDSFDRLQYLMEVINPLFAGLLEAQTELGIETIYEVTPLNLKHSVNYFSTNLFDENLLNPHYYTRLNEPQDTPELKELGQLLFFDPILSSNNQRSCASCHQPEKAFSDGLAKSLAFDHQGTIQRNAPGLINAVFADKYFYDLRTVVLEDQIQHVVSSPEEFSSDFLQIAERLDQSSEYRQKFGQAFPNITGANITQHTISTALAAYVMSLSAMSSPVDQYIRGEREYLEDDVKAGFNLFMGKAGCGTCHFAPVFNGSVPPWYQHSESEVLGVPATPDTTNATMDQDRGRYDGVLKERSDIYRHSFKTPTVRNAALTAPYMHNGVYHSLEQVIDFYDVGGGIGLGLEVPNQTLPDAPLNLTETEKQQLVAFMEALTDTTGLTGVPEQLPRIDNDLVLDKRVIGGMY